MCDCKECLRSRRVTKIRDYLRETGRHDLLDSLDDLYSAYVHDGEDHGVLRAIVDVQWPSAEAYMKTKGWVRDRE